MDLLQPIDLQRANSIMIYFIEIAEIYEEQNNYTKAIQYLYEGKSKIEMLLNQLKHHLIRKLIIGKLDNYIQKLEAKKTKSAETSK